MCDQSPVLIDGYLFSFDILYRHYPFHSIQEITPTKDSPGFGIVVFGTP